MGQSRVSPLFLAFPISRTEFTFLEEQAFRSPGSAAPSSWGVCRARVHAEPGTSVPLENSPGPVGTGPCNLRVLIFT